MRYTGWMRAAAACVGAAGLLSCSKPAAVVSADELLAQGWRQFRLEEFDAAAGSFQQALGPLAGGESRRLAALYGLGMVASLGAHGETGAGTRAAEFFRQVVDGDHTAKREMAGWAALAMVRERELPARSDAPALTAADRGVLLADYQHVMETYPQSAAAEEALLRRETLLVDTLDAADAQRAAEDINGYLAAHPDGGGGRATLFALLSTARETLRDYPGALAAAIAALDAKAAARDPLNPWQNNILEYYRIGMMAQFDVGDFATARRFYERFLAEYPRDQRAFNVRLLLTHLDETEAALRAGQPVKQLSALALPAAGAVEK